MPNTWRKIANSIPMRIFVGLTFFISGLFINIIQAILFMTLAYFNVELYRKINYYLTYTIWARKYCFKYLFDLILFSDYDCRDCGNV